MTDRERWEEIRDDVSLAVFRPDKSVRQAWLLGFNEACKRLAAQERELAEARRRVATQDAHIESMLRFICEAHDYLRGKGNPDLPAWVLSAMAQEILDCLPEEKPHD